MLLASLSLAVYKQVSISSFSQSTPTTFGRSVEDHIQVRRVLSKYHEISGLSGHTFRISSQKDILGDVDHFVVVAGLILRS